MSLCVLYCVLKSGLHTNEGISDTAIITLNPNGVVLQVLLERKGAAICIQYSGPMNVVRSPKNAIYGIQGVPGALRGGP